MTNTTLPNYFQAHTPAYAQGFIDCIASGDPERINPALDGLRRWLKTDLSTALLEAAREAESQRRQNILPFQSIGEVAGRVIGDITNKRGRRRGG